MQLSPDERHRIQIKYWWNIDEEASPLTVVVQYWLARRTVHVSTLGIHSPFLLSTEAHSFVRSDDDERAKRPHKYAPRLRPSATYISVRPYFGWGATLPVQRCIMHTCSTVESLVIFKFHCSQYNGHQEIKHRCKMTLIWTKCDFSGKYSKQWKKLTYDRFDYSSRIHPQHLQKYRLPLLEKSDSVTRLWWHTRRPGCCWWQENIKWWEKGRLEDTRKKED